MITNEFSYAQQWLALLSGELRGLVASLSNNSPHDAVAAAHQTSMKSDNFLDDDNNWKPTANDHTYGSSAYAR